MTRQQDLLYTKQDIEKAQKRVTYLDEGNINAVYAELLPSETQQKLIGKEDVEARNILIEQILVLQKESR